MTSFGLVFMLSFLKAVIHPHYSHAIRVRVGGPAIFLVLFCGLVCVESFRPSKNGRNQAHHWPTVSCVLITFFLIGI